jgi:hypothetical protein
MRSRNILWLHANIYHTNLGLKKAVAIVEATPGYEKLLPNCLRANDFWIYITKCYGRFEGCLGIYTIPENHCNDFEGFIAELRKLGIAKAAHIFWSTCFQRINPTTNWFDPKSQKWIFHWDTWIEEISAKGTELPYTLQDPKEFPIKGDFADIFILKELEKDATIDFIDIAQKLRLTLQGVRYHFMEHILKQGLLENFEIEMIPCDMAVSDFYFFIFKFPDTEKMARFALSLLDKPFVFILGKILGQSGMISELCLPRNELKNFQDSLSTLIRRGFIQSYDYIIQHFGEWTRQTISYKNFRNEAWIYNHEKHIQALKELERNFRF